MRLLPASLAAMLAFLIAPPASGGPLAYVANFVSNNVTVIDKTSNSVVNTIALPGASGPYGVAANTEGTKIYFSNYLNGSISVLDTTSGVAVTFSRVGHAPVPVSWDRAIRKLLERPVPDSGTSP